MGRFFNISTCLFLLLCVSACSTIETERRDWSEYKGPGYVYFQLEEPAPVEVLSDPLEPFNRAVGAANFVFLNYFVAPMSQAHRYIFPPPVRKRINNFTYTMAYPKRLVANVMQGELGTAGVETSRFLINGTVGLAGIFDPATDLGIETPEPEDFGLAFARWGWDSSVFLNLPYFGPSSIRDGTGEIFNFALTPTNWVPGGFIILGINSRCDEIEGLLRMVRSSSDPYEASRFFWSVQREARVARVEVSGGEPTSEETLLALYLGASDREFPEKAETGEVLIPATGKALPYSYWLQPGAAPLLFVLPGLGTHRENEGALAFAEMGFQRGFSVVGLSNLFHPEFMDAASLQKVPGYPPADIPELRKALELVHSDLTGAYPARFTGKKALMGMSMGGYHALFLASEEKSTATGFVFDRYVAVNPPVSLSYGASQLDKMYQAVNFWPEDEREKRIRRALHKAASLANENLKIEPGTKLPFDREESRYLIGLQYRLTLRSIIYESQQRHPAGVLRTEMSDWEPTASYREIGDYSWMEYFYAFVLPEFSSREAGLEEDKDFFYRGDLRSYGSRLRDNKAAYVFTSDNDFLLSEDDYAWLDSTFSDRLEVFNGGGHMGNLYKKEVQDRIFSSLQDLRVSSEVTGR